MPGRNKVMTSINVHICDKGKGEEGIGRDNEKPAQYQRRMSSTTTTSTPTVKLNNNVPASSNSTNVLVNTDESDSRSSEACYERCHYCDDLILPPIYQCFNGHIFCATCEPKILTRRCPECDAPLSDDMKIRNRYMEKQIEQVAFGCAPTCQVKLSWENVKDHWTYCSHRKHPICQHLDLPCAAESTSEEIIDHFKTAHNISGVQAKASYNQLAFVIPILQKVEKTHFRLKKISWTPHYFQFDNNMFFMRTLWDAGANSVTWVISQLILRDENEGQKNQNQGHDKNVSPYLARIKVTRPGSNATAEYTETQLEIQSLISPSSTYGGRQNQNNNKSFGFEMNMNKLEEKFCSQVTVQNGWRNNKTGRAYYKQELQWIVQVEIFPRSRRAHFRSFAYRPMLTTGYRITDREPRGYNIDQFLSTFSDIQ